jgi:hypothetical protein
MIFAALISWDGFTLFQHHNITSDIWAEHNIFFESQYDELHIMINYPTKFETYQPDDLRGVALTKWSRTDELMNKQTNRQTEKLYVPILLNVGLKIKIISFSNAQIFIIHID